MEFLQERFDNLEQSFKSELELTRVELKTEIQGVRNDLEMTRNELKTEIQNVYNEVKDLRNDLTAIEVITKNNLYDIAKLKSIK